MTDLAWELRQGPPLVDEDAAEVLRRLFDVADEDNRLLLENLTGADRLARALSGDPVTDLWRARREAALLTLSGRPYDGYARLLRSLRLHGRQPAGSLAEIEREALLAHLLAEGNQPAGALPVGEGVREALLRFVEASAGDPAGAAAQVRRAVDVTAGVQGYAGTLSDEALTSAWIVARGVPLLLQLTVRTTSLLVVAGHEREAAAVAGQLESDLTVLHAAAGTALPAHVVGDCLVALGNCWTEIDAARALGFFEAAAQWTPGGAAALYNAANCLVRLKRYDEALPLYGHLADVYVHGRPLEHARVLMAWCIASWKSGKAGVRRELADAIALFEANIPDDADESTLYSIKKYAEPGYLLMLSLLADDPAAIDDFFRCLWAVLRPEAKADLQPQTPQDLWERLLASGGAPLAKLRRALAPVAGVGVVHIASGTDRLVWAACGNHNGDFRVAVSAASIETPALLESFLTAMHRQRDADVIRDAGEVARVQTELVEIGARLGESIPEPVRSLILDLDEIFYLPHAFGSIDEFPLGGLRFNGQWLAQTATITRSPSPNHVLEMLAPNRARPDRGRRAIVVTGAPAVFGERTLEGIEAEVARVSHILRVLSYEPEAVRDADPDMVAGWLDGGVAAIHYVGHGIAGPVWEGLPLPSGGTIRPETIDRAAATSVATMPFLFLCACEAGQVRSGPGGYQTGVASTAASRGSPAVLSFTMAVPENRGYTIAGDFYRQAAGRPVADAVRAMANHVAPTAPAYTWLAVAFFGDPEFRLVGPPEGPRTATWATSLVAFACLRTPEAAEEARRRIPQAPPTWRSRLEEIIEHGFAGHPGDQPSAGDTTLSPSELLCIRAVWCLTKAHKIGLDEIPIRWPETPEATLAAVYELRFVTVGGTVLADTLLNGLGHALLGRLITWDQNSVEQASLFLDQAIEKLAEPARRSPFLARIRDETRQILRQFS